MRLPAQAACKDRERELMRIQIDLEQSRDQGLRATAAQETRIKEAEEQSQFRQANVEDLKKARAAPRSRPFCASELFRTRTRTRGRGRNAWSVPPAPAARPRWCAAHA